MSTTVLQPPMQMNTLVAPSPNPLSPTHTTSISSASPQGANTGLQAPLLSPATPGGAIGAGQPSSNSTNGSGSPVISQGSGTQSQVPGTTATDPKTLELSTLVSRILASRFWPCCNAFITLGIGLTGLYYAMLLGVYGAKQSFIANCIAFNMSTGYLPDNCEPPLSKGVESPPLGHKVKRSLRYHTLYSGPISNRVLASASERIGTAILAVGSLAMIHFAVKSLIGYYRWATRSSDRAVSGQPDTWVASSVARSSGLTRRIHLQEVGVSVHLEPEWLPVTRRTPYRRSSDDSLVSVEQITPREGRRASFDTKENPAPRGNNDIDQMALEHIEDVASNIGEWLPVSRGGEIHSSRIQYLESLSSLGPIESTAGIVKFYISLMMSTMSVFYGFYIARAPPRSYNRWLSPTVKGLLLNGPYFHPENHQPSTRTVEIETPGEILKAFRVAESSTSPSHTWHLQLPSAHHRAAFWRIGPQTRAHNIGLVPDVGRWWGRLLEQYPVASPFNSISFLGNPKKREVLILIDTEDFVKFRALGAPLDFDPVTSPWTRKFYIKEVVTPEQRRVYGLDNLYGESVDHAPEEQANLMDQQHVAALAWQHAVSMDRQRADDRLAAYQGHWDVEEPMDLDAESEAYFLEHREMFGAEMRAQNKMQTQTTEEEFAQKMNDAAWKTASSAASDKIQ